MTTAPTIVLRAESNHTCHQALALLESLQVFGGSICEAGVVVVSPLGGTAIIGPDRQKLEELGGVVVGTAAGEDLPDPVARKIWAAEWAEQSLQGDRLILMDT